MPFLTRPHFEDRQIVQYVEESIELSGLTKIAPTLLYENPFNTGQTSVTIMGVNGYLNEGVNGREYGFMVQPPILKLSGSTGYTTTDVTGYVLKALDSGGTVTWAPISVSADTNTFVTGGTLNGTKLDLTWNTGGSVPSIDLSSLSDVGAFTSTTTNNRIIPTNTQGNVVSSDKSSILGGDSNTINTNSARSIIVGGRGNTVEGEYSFIGNGLGNSISGRGFWNTVINGDNNDLSLDPLSNYNTVVGNSHSITGTSLVANSILGGQSSGIYTLAGIDPINSTIVGGNGNSIYGPDNASIIGGDNNLINGEANNTSIIGGQNNNILLTSTSSFIGGGENNTLSNTTNSAIIGGQNITGTTDDTVYVPNLNIGTVGGGASINNLGIDSSGNVVTGTTGGGGGATIDPYQDEGNVTSITWDVSGTSTNYEATLTGVTTLTMSNVRNGDYGTLIVTQDGVGSRTLSFAGGTHKVVNGGGGAPTLTTTAGATDILSFTYNGTNFYWTVGNDYT